MVILQNAGTVYGFDENEIAEWVFSEQGGVPTAVILFRNGVKRTVTEGEALQLLEVFSQLYMGDSVDSSVETVAPSALVNKEPGDFVITGDGC